jgi:hypothetical protein
MILALIAALASPQPGIHISVQNLWVAPIYAYELDAPLTCPIWTFSGGPKPFDIVVLSGHTEFANDDGTGCAPHPKLYIGVPGYLEFDCWVSVDMGNVTLTNGNDTACTMKSGGNDYSVNYHQKPDDQWK